MPAALPPEHTMEALRQEARDVLGRGAALHVRPYAAGEELVAQTGTHAGDDAGLQLIVRHPTSRVRARDRMRQVLRALADQGET